MEVMGSSHRLFLPGSLGGRWGLFDLIHPLLGGCRGFSRIWSGPLVSRQTTYVVTVQAKGWIEIDETIRRWCFKKFRKE